MQDLDITLHPHQWSAFTSTKRITAFVAGIQSGKTLCGASWMSRYVAQYDGADQNFILASPNYKILNQSAGPALAKFMQGAGQYKKADDVYALNGGGHLWCRSMTDPNSCEGLSQVRAIWIDEAGLLDYLSWSNLLGRAAFCQAPIFISTTPYRLNWLYDMYQDWRKGLRDDCNFIVCKSLDNPYFPAEEIERQRRILTPALFRMKYEGSFQRPGGLVFADFDPAAHIVDEYEIPRADYQIYGGVDIGFNDPTAIILVAVHRQGRDMLIFREHYQVGMTVMDRIAVMGQMRATYGVSQFIIDGSAPADIEAMRQAGLPVMANQRYAGSVFDGVTQIQQLLREFRMKIMRGKCPNLLDEFNSYSYKESKDASLSDDIEDDHNHAIDAVRGVVMQVFKSFLQSVPSFSPAQTHLQKLLAGQFAPAKAVDEW